MVLNKAMFELCASLPPFRITEFPDLIAKHVICTTTSGLLVSWIREINNYCTYLASKMINSTPMGLLTRYNSSPSSSLVARETFPVGSSSFTTSKTPANKSSYLADRSNRLNNDDESDPFSTWVFASYHLNFKRTSG